MQQAEPGLVTLHQDIQTTAGRNIFAAHFGPAGHRDREIIREAREERRFRFAVMVTIDTKRLLFESMLRHAMEMMHGRHGPPTDEEAGMNMSLGPVENLREFVPIGDVLERQGLNRRTGNDEAVKLAILNLIPGMVEGDEVILRRVARHMAADAHQSQLHLQRRRADKAGDLGFSLDLVRHQIEQRNPHRANILTRCDGFIEHLHAFTHE